MPRFCDLFCQICATWDEWTRAYIAFGKINHGDGCTKDKRKQKQRRSLVSLISDLTFDLTTLLTLRSYFHFSHNFGYISCAPGSHISLNRTEFDNASCTFLCSRFFQLSDFHFVFDMWGLQFCQEGILYKFLFQSLTFSDKNTLFKMLDVERPNLVEELAETFDQSIQLTLEVFNQSFSLGFGGF